MRVGSASPHFRGDRNRFHDLLLGRACRQCQLRVPAEVQQGHWVTCATATAMSCLVFDGSAPSANTRWPNTRKAPWIFRRELPSLLGQILRNIGIHVLFHVRFPLDLIVYRQPCSSARRRRPRIATRVVTALQSSSFRTRDVLA
jgi:hypothetical protein